MPLTHNKTQIRTPPSCVFVYFFSIEKQKTSKNTLETLQKRCPSCHELELMAPLGLSATNIRPGSLTPRTAGMEAHCLGWMVGMVVVCLFRSILTKKHIICFKGVWMVGVYTRHMDPFLFLLGIWIQSWSFRRKSFVLFV